MRSKKMKAHDRQPWLTLFLLLIAANLISTTAFAEKLTLLNVSYDPTRELYEGYNKLFAAHWQQIQHHEIEIQQSHGGTGKQAQAVLSGLEADVVTLALAYDIDMLSKKGGLLKPEWQKEFPENSSPYTSTIVFLVRKGNPKGIKD